MTKWQVLGWIGVAYVLIVVAYCALAYRLNRSRPDTEDSHDHELALSLAGARRREVLGDGAPAGATAPPLSSLPAPHAGPIDRDATIGRDQYRPEARRRVRDLQPLSLRQRESLGIVKKDAPRGR
jgi:hypothetical protein